MLALIKSDANDLCRGRFPPTFYFYFSLKLEKILKSSLKVWHQRFLFSDSRNRGVGLLVGGSEKRNDEV